MTGREEQDDGQDQFYRSVAEGWELRKSHRDKECRERKERGVSELSDRQLRYRPLVHPVQDPADFIAQLRILSEAAHQAPDGTRDVFQQCIQMLAMMGAVDEAGERWSYRLEPGLASQESIEASACALVDQLLATPMRGAIGRSTKEVVIPAHKRKRRALAIAVAEFDIPASSFDAAVKDLERTYKHRAARLVTLEEKRSAVGKRRPENVGQSPDEKVP